MNTPYYYTYNAPVPPLPNPGEGGPVGPGTNGGTPVAPLPNPGEGGPVGPGANGGTPVVPLPNPGEGGPVGTIPGFIITTFPRPNIPCYFCTSGRTANVRFLNTANGYDPFYIYVNNNLVVNGLAFSEISEYGKVAAGSQTITIAAENGYIYVQKPVRFSADTKYTVAIITTQTGLDIQVITDTPCETPNGNSCIRTANLSYNNGPLDVVLHTGFVVFNDVAYQEVTPFRRIQPGHYQFDVVRSNRVQPRGRSEALVSFTIDVGSESAYSIYIFNWGSAPESVRTIVVEDTK